MLSQIITLHGNYTFLSFHEPLFHNLHKALNNCYFYLILELINPYADCLERIYGGISNCVGICVY